MAEQIQSWRHARLSIGLLMGVVAFAGSASAATFTSSELSYDAALLSQFNLISLGGYNVETGNTGGVTDSGRVVAGSVTTGATGLTTCSSCSGNTTFGASSSTTAGTTAASSSNPGYGALTVFGSVMGAVQDVSSLQAKSIYVAGNLSGSSSATANSNGAKGYIGAGLLDTVAVAGTRASGSSVSGPLNAVSSVFPFGTEKASFADPLKALYAGLANLPGSPNVTAQALSAKQSGFLTANSAYTVNGVSYGVVTTSMTDLIAAGKSGFTGVANGSANAATFVIVTGDGAGAALPTLSYSDGNSGKVIYDFVNATTLATGGAFNASILAPFANLTNTTGSINGTVVVASMTQTQALYNTNAFTGSLAGLVNFAYNARVPEPASMALLAAGLGGAVWARRRRR